MTTKVVPLKTACGRVLSTSITEPEGRKLMPRGHLLTEDDIKLLTTMGMLEVWVAEVEANEVGEQSAVLQLAQELGCGALEIRMAAGGRANIHTTKNCVVLIDDALLTSINSVSSLKIATVKNFSFVAAGDRVASVKSAPFAAIREDLYIALDMLASQGPVLQGRPIVDPVVCVIFSDAAFAERGRMSFENILRQRLERFGVAATYSLSVIEEEPALSASINHMLRAKPTVIIMASTTAPAGPADAVGSAMLKTDCVLEMFMAPVEPGNLLLLGYHGDVPVVSAPGCFRSAKPNVLDIVLPALLARYRLSASEVCAMGQGGILV